MDVVSAPEDEQQRPFPCTADSFPLAPDQPPAEQIAAHLDALKDKGAICRGRALSVRFSKGGIRGGHIEPRVTRPPCPSCALERLGFTPDEARASFGNFVCDPAELRTHLAICRSFAADPRAVLLLLGNVGAGKTHLGTAVLRDLIAREVAGLDFIRSRDFFADHFRSLRPVPFDEEPPHSPLPRCQAARVLFLDDLKAPPGNRDYEDVLLALFDHRIGHHLPTIITSNLGGQELETALGSRCYDRLRGAAFAVLEFGFESKRAALAGDYLNRAASAVPRPAEPTPQPALPPARTIPELRAQIKAVDHLISEHPTSDPNDPDLASAQRKRFRELERRKLALSQQLAGLD